MNHRNTIQRSMVYETVNRLKCHATAVEIYDLIAAEHPSVSRGTVYRNLNRLAEEGVIRKILVPGGADRFDHLSQKHYHARCLCCGRLFDIEMDYIDDLEKAIRDAHGFAVSGHDILFNGVCADCRDSQNHP